MRVLYGVLMLLVTAGAVSADDAVTVAVAANFRTTAEAVARSFEARHGTGVKLVSGSTGKLYAQILAGAPFDVFLAADQARPQRLVDSSQALPESRVTYAIGQLVLWAPRGEASLGRLRRGDYRRLAIANPALAPYGSAAQEVLARLDLGASLDDARLVNGENVAQAFTFAATGNADLAFVALSQVLSLPEGRRGAWWQPPAGLHAPIRQDAVLLTRKPAARIFLDYLVTGEGRVLVESAGYRTSTVPGHAGG